MKTTELFVELVLIGSMVLAIAVLPLYPEIAAGRVGIPLGGGASAVEIVVGGAVLLGLVYLIGVVFDRLADTILETWEKHLRLRFAAKSATSSKGENGDPFPEDVFKMRILLKGDSALEWMDYLRTRVRLARSLLVFLPGLTLALQIALISDRCGPPAGIGALVVSPWIGVLLLFIYMAVPLMRWLARQASRHRRRLKFRLMTPRTDSEARFRAYCRLRDLRSQGRVPMSWNLFDFGVGLPALVFAFVLSLSGLVIWNCTTMPIAAIAATGFGLTLLSAWAWSRILNTYRVYLRDIGHRLRDLPETG